MYNHFLHRGWLSFVLYACVVCTGCISEEVERESEEDIKVGDTLPVFSVTMDDGHVVATNFLHGKPSCIIFFNTSCADCRKELPVVNHVYETFGDGLVNFMAISREQDAASVAGYWQENGFFMPYSAQPDRSVYHLFATSVIPRIYISDGNLQVRAVYTDDPLATEEELTAMLRSLLP